MLASCSSESSSEADNQADATSDAVADVTADVTDASAEETTDTVEDTAPAEEFVESRLYRYLEGQFDSRDQSLVDFDYFEISLEVCAAVVPELLALPPRRRGAARGLGRVWPPTARLGWVRGAVGTRGARSGLMLLIVCLVPKGSDKGNVEQL